MFPLHTVHHCLMRIHVVHGRRGDRFKLVAGLTQSGLLYYNNMLSLPMMASYMLLATTEVQEILKLPQVYNPQFLVSQLVLAAVPLSQHCAHADLSSMGADSSILLGLPGLPSERLHLLVRYPYSGLDLH